ncbi:MAG: iron uptake porin [Acaryochloridaceae cyanobacterium RU_4_10]|nr:iron uptake porin [Acaryochloridaceae cyanobacterium RU_4_10]
MGVSQASEIAAEPTVRQSILTPLLSNDNLGQVTSVSQLSDVQPTDWAFQALESLVQRYGCVAGYPDSTFRGNRAATRYEMAALLNACLDQMSDRLASKEDLETVKALQTEFKSELSTLTGRVDALEARTKQLEGQSFSTTTKLNGTAAFIVQYGDVSKSGFTNPQTGNAVAAGSGRPTAIGVVRLDFNTSFNGSDLLQTSLAAGNNGEDLYLAWVLTSTQMLPAMPDSLCLLHAEPMHWRYTLTAPIYSAWLTLSNQPRTYQLRLGQSSTPMIS